MKKFLLGLCCFVVTFSYLPVQAAETGQNTTIENVQNEESYVDENELVTDAEPDEILSSDESVSSEENVSFEEISSDDNVESSDEDQNITVVSPDLETEEKDETSENTAETVETPESTENTENTVEDSSDDEPKAERKNGFAEENGSTYYYINGNKCKGEVKINNYWYFF